MFGLYKVKINKYIFIQGMHSLITSNHGLKAAV